MTAIGKVSALLEALQAHALLPDEIPIQEVVPEVVTSQGGRDWGSTLHGAVP